MMDSSTESSLLYAARNGDIETVKSLVMALKDNRLSFDLNCTGMYKYTIVFWLYEELNHCSAYYPYRTDIVRPISQII